jgi:hypothetical protein
MASYQRRRVGAGEAGVKFALRLRHEMASAPHDRGEVHVHFGDFDPERGSSPGVSGEPSGGNDRLTRRTAKIHARSTQVLALEQHDWSTRFRERAGQWDPSLAAADDRRLGNDVAHGDAGGRGKIRSAHQPATASKSNAAIGNSDFRRSDRMMLCPRVSGDSRSSLRIERAFAASVPVTAHNPLFVGDTARLCWSGFVGVARFGTTRPTRIGSFSGLVSSDSRRSC